MYRTVLHWLRSSCSDKDLCRKPSLLRDRGGNSPAVCPVWNGPVSQSDHRSGNRSATGLWLRRNVGTGGFSRHPESQRQEHGWATVAGERGPGAPGGTTTTEASVALTSAQLRLPPCFDASLLSAAG